MRMLSTVLYKELLQFKGNKTLVLQLILQSIGYGLLIPIIFYLRLVGIIPIPWIDPPEEARLATIKDLQNVIPILLPLFMSMIASPLAIPSIVSETVNRTLERLFSLPLSWLDVFAGKFLLCLAISLICSYTLTLTYFASAGAVVEGFTRPNFVGTFLLLLVPAVSFYTVSVALFVSARARSVRAANAYAGILTSGLFGALFC
ncbi:ABC transporter permease [Dehalococcoidia bacterium]|nr:ABC transporter permease [Dehalococcoidia bacterium]